MSHQGQNPKNYYKTIVNGYLLWYINAVIILKYLDIPRLQQGFITSFLGFLPLNVSKIIDIIPNITTLELGIYNSSYQLLMVVSPKYLPSKGLGS